MTCHSVSPRPSQPAASQFPHSIRFIFLHPLLNFYLVPSPAQHSLPPLLSSLLNLFHPPAPSIAKLASRIIFSCQWSSSHRIADCLVRLLHLVSSPTQSPSLPRPCNPTLLSAKINLRIRRLPATSISSLVVPGLQLLS